MIPASAQSLLSPPLTSMDDSPHAAAYGLACEACARAKCKCVVQSGGRCERYVESRSIIYLSMQLMYDQYSCDRLDKICQPTKSKRQLKSSNRVHSSRVEKSRSDVDVSRLERKLDQLVAQLKGQQQSLASPSNSDASSLIPPSVHVGHRHVTTSSNLNVQHLSSTKS